MAPSHRNDYLEKWPGTSPPSIARDTKEERMWKRVKDNLDSGIERIKWFSSFLNERMKIEVSLFKLLYQSTEMEKKRAELMKTIGEKVFELRNRQEKHVLRDPVILEAMNDVERLDAEIEDTKKKASEIGRIEA